MSPTKWNALSPTERMDAVKKHDTSGMMSLPEWQSLLLEMSKPYEELTAIQRMVVDEIP